MKCELKAAGLDKVKKCYFTQVLDTIYALRLMDFVSKKAKERCVAERKTLLDERRELFKNNEWVEYHNFV